MTAAGHTTSGARPEDTHAFTVHLRANPEDSAGLTCVLHVDGAPRYALRPTGPHATNVTGRLIDILAAGPGAPASAPSIEPISVPGILLTDSVMVHGGKLVRWLDIARSDRINAWQTHDLAAAATATILGAASAPAAVTAVARLLTRVHEEHRNDSTLRRDRALNYSATNAVQPTHAVLAASALELELDTLTVHKSRFDRPHSECWYVHATFADPDDPHRARRIRTWTIDVADASPVGGGITRTWTIA